jgi:uncharacterized protein
LKLILPDINFLIALIWPNHIFHETARRRMEQHRGKWATCLVTELGFIRVSSSPAALQTVVSPRQAAQFLSLTKSDRHHVYLDGGPPPAQHSWNSVQGHKQVTDAWLIWFATNHGARLITFDRKMSALSAEADVEILSADA